MEIATMKWFRRPSRTLGIISLIIGLMPYWQHVTMRNLPDGWTETRSVFTLGIPPSPLLLVEQTHSEQVHGREMITGGQRPFKLEFVSWSMLSLVLAALFFVVDRWWGRDRNSAPGIR
jgi:disulfide bond formation protein DsbB